MSVALLMVGLFIWPLTLLSTIMLGGGAAIALWVPQDERRPVAYIFAWTCGFIMLANFAILCWWLAMLLGF